MRRFLSLQALALGLLALVCMAVMSWLGVWQFSVYDNHQRADAEKVLAEPAIPLRAVLGPDQAFPEAGVSRPVVVQGHWLPDQQVYVRRMSGATGRYAVVTPLVTPTGSALMIVRGSIPDLTAIRALASLPSGPVSVRGVLEPSTSSSPPPDRQGVMAKLSVPSLVNVVRPDLYSGYLITARPGQPPPEPAAGLAGLRPVPAPLPSPSRWAGVRNLLYACQWWVFAAFTAGMWWRMTGDMTRLEEASPADVADAESGTLPGLG